MKLTGPVETKVAAGGGTGALVSLLFGLAAQYHWFAPPSPYLTALVVTVVSFLAGWLAPHTSRSLGAVTVTGVNLSPAQLAALDQIARTAAGAGSPVVVQPSDPGPIETGRP